MKCELQELAHHRNGVSGEPFWVARFRDLELQASMVAVYFEPEPGEAEINPRCAVLDVNLLAGIESADDATVAFGENSWRGDRYAFWIRKWIAERESEVTS